MSMAQHILADQLATRTKQYALRIIRLVRALPRTMEGRVIANQLMRCGTAVGANYRAARRARSRAEFVAKIGIVIEEADEAIFWLELIIESEKLSRNVVAPLLQETEEILKIMITSGRTAQQNAKR